jgi:hypothetical protein
MKKKKKLDATAPLRELTADALGKVAGGYIMLPGLSVRSEPSSSASDKRDPIIIDP